MAEVGSTAVVSSVPLRIFGVVQVLACLLYGVFAFMALFGLAMCTDSGDNAFCNRAWLLWFAANVAALVNLVVGILMIVYRRPGDVAAMPTRMRVYIIVSIVAWLVIAAFVDIGMFGHPSASAGRF